MMGALNRGALNRGALNRGALDMGRLKIPTMSIQAIVGAAGTAFTREMRDMRNQVSIYLCVCVYIYI